VLNGLIERGQRVVVEPVGLTSLTFEPRREIIDGLITR
jgi:hypothetical protein